jgi:hypothetical protein
MPIIPIIKNSQDGSSNSGGLEKRTFNKVNPQNEALGVSLRKIGKGAKNVDDIGYNSYVFLQDLNCSVVNKNKDFSLLSEQSETNKISNPNIENLNKKSRKDANLSSKRNFANKEDPFYESEVNISKDESAKKASENMRNTYSKSFSIASYLASNVNTKTEERY